MFSCEYCEISKNTFFTEYLWTTASKDKEKVLGLNTWCRGTGDTNISILFLFWINISVRLFKPSIGIYQSYHTKILCKLMDIKYSQAVEI